MSTNGVLNRRPRKWVALWTYSGDDLATVERIKEEVVPFYKEELLEVYVPTVEGEQTNPGFVFLRIVNPSSDLLTKVESVTGVGGILSMEISSPFDVGSYLINVPEAEEVKEGDVVKVVVGPLKGNSGTVLRVTAWLEDVEVKLDIFGKLIEVCFKKEEVRLWKKLKTTS